MRMSRAEELILERKPILCKKCKGKMLYQGVGLYTCRDCEEEVYDDFGKMRLYLEENAAPTAVEISKILDIPLEIISYYLKDGKVEIPEGSRLFIKCQRCGCSLKYGRFCNDCTKEMAAELRSSFGKPETEKPQPASQGSNRMRYL